MSSETYCYASARRGDYGFVESSAELERVLAVNIRRAKSPDERQHALDQVSYFAACGTISSERADRLRRLLANL